MASELMSTPVLEIQYCQLLGSPRKQNFKADDGSEKLRQWTIDALLDSQIAEHLEWIENVESQYEINFGTNKSKATHWCPIKENKAFPVARNEAQRFYIAKFKTNEFIRSDGTTNEPPIVYDIYGNKWPEEKLIGNGSKMKIAYTIYAWGAGSKSGAGLTLQPVQAMVMEHVAYSGANTDCVFETQAQPEVDLSDCPMPDAEAAPASVFDDVFDDVLNE